MCPGFESLCKCCEFTRVLLFGVGCCSVSSDPGIVGMSSWEFSLLHVQGDLLKLPPVGHRGVLGAGCPLRRDPQADLS